MTDLPPPLSQPPEDVIVKRSRFVVMAGWQDCPHITPEMIAEEKGRIPPHEFEARSLGKPTLGAGAIYPIPEAEFVVDPFVIPDWMPQAYALDVGWNRTAAVWGAHDRDNDVVYLYGEYYRGQAEAPIHAAAIKARGAWIPGVIDPASRGRSQHDGTQLMKQFTELGLNLTIADNAFEAGIYAVLTRLSTGRLKVFRTLVNWLKEFRFYQRDEKGHVKSGLQDHLMDSCRYWEMSARAIAIVRPPEQWTTGKTQTGHVSEYDPYARQP